MLHEHPDYAPNRYEQEGGTQMLAQRCIFCQVQGRPGILRDPESIERGCGPVCAAKHGIYTEAGPVDQEALKHALETAPALMREAVEGKLPDARKAVSAAIHASGRAWETGAADAASYVGSAMELSSALGYPGTYDALMNVAILGVKYDEQGNVIDSGKKPKGIVLKDAGQGMWQLALPFLKDNVWRPTLEALKAAGIRNRKNQLGKWESLFPGTEIGWIRILNAMVPTLAGALGVMPDGEIFVVPNAPLPLPAPPAPAPPSVGAEKAANPPEPGKLDAEAREVQEGGTVFLKDKPMVVAWISNDRVRAILLTPEAAARSMEELGFLHGKRFGGVSVGMREVKTTPVTQAEVARVEEKTAEPMPPPAPDFELPEGLHPWQRDGAIWLRQRKAGILAFEQGVGKTATAICAAQTPMLVVCNKSLRVNWQREISKLWRPDLAVYTISTGAKRDLASFSAADVVIVNYDIVHKLIDDFAEKGFRTIICDESQKLKDFKLSWKKDDSGRWQPRLGGSRRAQSIWEIAQPIEYRFMLSGTPMDNGRPRELFGQLNLVSPRQFTNFRTFCEYFCGPDDVLVKGGRKVRTYDGATNTLELHEAIQGKCYMRVTKDVLNLPPKARETVLLSLDDVTAKEYNAAARDLLSYIEKNYGWAAMNSAAKAEALRRLGVLRRLCGIGKVEAFAEQCRDNWEGSHRPFLVWAYHKEVQQALLAAFKQFTDWKVGSILAEDKPDEQTRMKTHFQDGLPESAPPEQRDYLDVLVCSLSMAREGHTLTRAEEAYFIERLWSPFHLEQAEDRIHRIGTKNQVTIFYYDAPGTVDEEIGVMLDRKLRAGREVIEGYTLTDAQVADTLFGKTRELKRNPSKPTQCDWLEAE